MSVNWPGSQTPHRGALHLIWAVPLSVVGALLAVGLASFEWCGITQCRWGDRGSPIAVGLLAFLAGFLVALPFWLVRWTYRTSVRLGVGTILAVVVAVIGFWAVTHP